MTRPTPADELAKRRCNGAVLCVLPWCDREARFQASKREQNSFIFPSIETRMIGVSVAPLLFPTEPRKHQFISSCSFPGSFGNAA